MVCGPSPARWALAAGRRRGAFRPPPRRRACDSISSALSTRRSDDSTLTRSQLGYHGGDRRKAQSCVARRSRNAAAASGSRSSVPTAAQLPVLVQVTKTARGSSDRLSSWQLRSVREVTHCVIVSRASFSRICCCPCSAHPGPVSSDIIRHLSIASVPPLRGPEVRQAEQRPPDECRVSARRSDSDDIRHGDHYPPVARHLSREHQRSGAAAPCRRPAC